MLIFAHVKYLLQFHVRDITWQSAKCIQISTKCVNEKCTHQLTFWVAERWRRWLSKPTSDLYWNRWYSWTNTFGSQRPENDGTSDVISSLVVLSLVETQTDWHLQWGLRFVRPVSGKTDRSPSILSFLIIQTKLNLLCNRLNWFDSEHSV